MCEIKIGSNTAVITKLSKNSNKYSWLAAFQLQFWLHILPCRLTETSYMKLLHIPESTNNVVTNLQRVFWTQPTTCILLHNKYVLIHIGFWYSIVRCRYTYYIYTKHIYSLILYQNQCNYWSQKDDFNLCGSYRG